ncbi:MAG: AbrB/MazE/SpoVT family DNA-binding domain-containing protein [Ruminococcaceae bacterium]|nr:AbrB/MazE/SpoVT family DNA-binding domain-containing protein [Oscillospiraceae bacterium]
MRTKGNVRAIDELGRIVVPIEFRNELDIKSGDLLRMDIEGEKIVLQKNTPACIFCGAQTALTKHQSKTICINCIREISKIPN